MSKKKIPAKPLPILQQYANAKAAHPEMILAFRVGDFYEFFDEDAETVSKLIGLTLTTRDKAWKMCGFPYHQLETYLAKILRHGHKVAICEQVQDVANVPIRREVTRVAFPGDENISENPA